MNNANTKKLFADFPKLFRQAGNSRSAMQFGFECGDGWFDLVYQLSNDIEAEAKKLGLKAIHQNLRRLRRCGQAAPGLVVEGGLRQVRFGTRQRALMILE